MSETISGSIERITFHSVESGYAVLRVKVSGRRDLLTVVGTITSVVAGEYIQATGQWVTDREHGIQFKAESLVTTPPHTVEGIVKYLSSGLVRGIGPHYAKKIVEVFGDRTLQVIDESPTHLSEIKGIGPRRLQQIRQSWEEQKGVRSIMLFLKSHGVGTARAVRIYKTYGDQAVELVRANPYRLTTDIWGVGFKIADELARSLGLPANSVMRARAAIRFILQELSASGNVGSPEPLVIEKVIELTDIDEPMIRDAIDECVGEKEIVREIPPREALALTGSDPWLFLTPLHLAETNVARLLVRLNRGVHPLANEDAAKLIAGIEAKMGITLAKTQRLAIEASLQEKLLVITGGPGVGKTTIVRGIIEIFNAKRQRIVLCAPTGRAAKRLSESTGQEAKTIHRLLEFDPANGGFKKSADEPIEADLLVMDEASMVDIVLLNQLLRAVPPWACVVLVGDVDQLPSVGPGTVLADLIHSGQIPVVRLTEIFRQAEQSWIVRAAHAINSGEEPQSAPAGQGDFYFVEAREPEQVLERIVMMVRERIPSRFGLDPLVDVQVLAPMNRTELGVRNLNSVLQAALNPESPQRKEVQRYGQTFRVGDKVIQTQNNYQKEVFNGDIGRIQSIDEVGQEVEIHFEGRPVVYEFNELDEVSLAYAISVHKSQGSEYPAVVIPVHTQHYIMLQRNLFYTGVTRGKRLVVLVGSRYALRQAVHNAEIRNRCTLLRWRIQALAHAADASDARLDSRERGRV